MVPAQVGTVVWGQGCLRSPLGQAREPVAFPRALRSRAGGAPSVWRHTRRGDRYVTVMIDLTPVRDRSGPARLLDVVPNRSKTVLKTWLSQRDQDWRGRVEVVATGRFHRVPRAPPARSSPRPGR